MAISTASDLSGSGRVDMLTRPVAAAFAAVATGASGYIHTRRLCFNTMPTYAAKKMYYKMSASISQSMSAVDFRTLGIVCPYYGGTYHTTPYHTIPYHTIPYHTISYHTIP